MNRWVFIGAVSGFIGVAMGAFGAHGLAEKLSERSLSVYHTAAQYQMYHALALLFVGVWLGGSAQTAGWCFTFGTIVFSGSLYLLAVTDIKILGAITPIGGLLFLIGWASLAWSAWNAGRP